MFVPLTALGATAAELFGLTALAARTPTLANAKIAATNPASKQAGLRWTLSHLNTCWQVCLIANGRKDRWPGKSVCLCKEVMSSFSRYLFINQLRACPPLLPASGAQS